MKRRNRLSALSLTLLAAGFILRAVTPAGYMPGSLSGGLPFELCPDGMPPGFIAGIAGDGHAHHHHQHDGPAQAADACDLGHMLGVAIANHSLPEFTTNVLPAVFAAGEIARGRIATIVSGYSPRGPPRLL